MIRTSEEWERRFKLVGALWLYDAVPVRPHAELTSGAHSNGFMNSERIMEDPRLLSEACSDLLEIIQGGARNLLDEVNVIAGPAMGAITLAHEFARTAGERYNTSYRRAYAEKDGAAPGEMRFDRTRILEGDRVLFVEDVVTTGGSVERMANAVVQAGGIPYPYIVALVNRSGATSVGGRKIFSLIERTFDTWAPSECPLCADGSEALRPKIAGNWARLTA